MACQADVAGLAGCPCINATEFARITSGHTTATIGGSTYTAFTSGADYAPQYGLGCSSHDHTTVPYCEPEWCGPPINGECVPRWCADMWCWVDAQSCLGVPAPGQSSYFAPLPLYFSYETCNGTNAFSSFYETIMAPRPPPPVLPSPAPAPPPRYYTEEISLGSAGVGLCFLLFALLTVFLIGRTRAYRAKERGRERVAAQVALEATRKMHFWAAFIRASDFVALGRLTSYEELRDRGLHVYRDSFDELAFGDDYTIFISQCARARLSPLPLCPSALLPTVMRSTRARQSVDVLQSA